MSRFAEKYKNEVAPALMEKYQFADKQIVFEFKISPVK